MRGVHLVYCNATNLCVQYPAPQTCAWPANSADLFLFFNREDRTGVVNVGVDHPRGNILWMLLATERGERPDRGHAKGSQPLYLTTGHPGLVPVVRQSVWRRWVSDRVS